MENREAWAAGLSRAEVSERSFLSSVYFWMSLGLAMTGFVAWWMAANPPAILWLVAHPVLVLILAVVQIGLVIGLSAAIMRIGTGTATFGFGLYAFLNGVLFSTIFLAYTGVSIASTFFITAGTFASASLYGYSTKRNLSSLGSIGLMFLI
ncbi:MAG: Bax inhibitor-1/YccA family protein, partial [Candidatus Omnitrophica bacterium]|nr:Bax inhibitor-1/YccA family protein [Candidatus Omnitrophota bacterium]